MNKDNKKKVAILGATGHIAKNIILGMCDKDQYDLYLIARSIRKLEKFISDSEITNKVNVSQLEHFEHSHYDVIINCIGIGDPGKLIESMSDIFLVTETYDNLILKYMNKSPHALYINFSSGAAYLADYSQPASSETKTDVFVNKLTPAEFYGISKINSEAKHRSYNHLKIVDLRIFGFFSRHIDLRTKFFLNEVVHSIDSKHTLLTSSDNIFRDYVHPRDLINLIELIIENCTMNGVFDVYSLKPVSKFSILNYFSANYGLQYECNDTGDLSSVTGRKNHYYSENYHAKHLGYAPQYDSLATIIEEYNFLKNK